MVGHVVAVLRFRLGVEFCAVQWDRSTQFGHETVFPWERKPNSIKFLGIVTLS